MKNTGSTEPQGLDLPPVDVSPQSIGDVSTARAEAQRRRYRVGDVLLGRYRIAGELGQGGMGVVFHCFDQIGGIEVALKALPSELSHNTLEMEEVRDNFQLVQGLAHPNIAQIKTLERDAETGEYYLVMECVAGVNLRRWRKDGRNGRRTVAEMAPVLRQVAAAVDYAHSRHIMHRDIKPANVVLATDGTVKVLDFGLAAQIHTSMSRVSMVKYGTSGTGPYMAPEQWRGQRQGASTDQYALAVMAYELLSGALPFENPDPIVLREAVLNEVPARIQGLDPREWRMLARGLAKDAAARFPDCTGFVEALAGTTTAGRRTGSGETGGGSRDRGKGSGSGRWWVAAFVLALAAGGWAGWRFDYKPRVAREVAAREQTQVAVSLLAEAKAFQSAKRYPEAAAKVQEALKLDETNAEALRLRDAIRLAIGMEQAVPEKTAAEMALARTRSLRDAWSGHVDELERLEAELRNGQTFFEPASQ